jgi:3-oxoacyl-[acyl-carrier protein] reductase
MTRALEGKVALVTGGSRGIGAAIAKRLGMDGASVALTYASAQGKADEVVKAIEATGGRALAIRADSGDVKAVKEAVAETVRTFGRLDVLVSSAGIAVRAPLDQFSVDDFDRMVAVNVRAAFGAAQEAARHMGEGGRIITIGSVNADRMPFAGGSVYAMTKAAIAGLTRGLARDLGPRGITVNNVQPKDHANRLPPSPRLNNEGQEVLDMTKRILVPLDRSDTAESVLPLVSDIARSSGATVRLLHVSPIPKLQVGDHGRVVAYEDQEMERLEASGLEHLRAAEAQLDGVPVETVVRFGDPVEEIVGEAEVFGADLIALATTRRTWLQRVFGNVPDKVFRAAAVPTLLLGPR